ncbi:UbiA prenyltransferase family-domain-containing protein [Lipomyces japonicus]|uniref:UbiA prenyltransferase family-domain-containing protein n=1 Tax=Lipomyces japonicus TaxID=56871 RepID=UPI0034CF3028
MSHISTIRRAPACSRQASQLAVQVLLSCRTVPIPRTKPWDTRRWISSHKARLHSNSSQMWERKLNWINVRNNSCSADFFSPNNDITTNYSITRAFSHSNPTYHGDSTSSKTITSKSRLRLELAKPKLTALIVLSAMSTYAIAPLPVIASASPSLSTLLFLTIGTALTSASANALNMAREPVYDGMMSRTRARPIVRGLVSTKEAVQFAVATGLSGTAALFVGVNVETAVLAVSNIAIYAGLYTSLKRKSILNTWAGAVVGAIPPLMGWSAAGGSLLDPGAWCCAGLLYAWQFPHFNALSFNIREEYKYAGYVMTAWVNPALNARVALRYSIAMIPLCFGLWYYGVTDALFLADSTVANAWLIACAVNFWKECRGNVPTKLAGPSARKLFWASIWQLPAVLVLAMIHKTGLWDGVFGRDSENKELRDVEDVEINLTRQNASKS